MVVAEDQVPESDVPRQFHQRALGVTLGQQRILRIGENIIDTGYRGMQLRHLVVTGKKLFDGMHELVHEALECHQHTQRQLAVHHEEHPERENQQTGKPLQELGNHRGENLARNMMDDNPVERRPAVGPPVEVASLGTQALDGVHHADAANLDGLQVRLLHRHVLGIVAPGSPGNQVGGQDQDGTGQADDGQWNAGGQHDPYIADRHQHVDHQGDDPGGDDRGHLLRLVHAAGYICGVALGEELQRQAEAVPEKPHRAKYGHLGTKAPHGQLLDNAGGELDENQHKEGRPIEPQPPVLS